MMNSDSRVEAGKIIGDVFLLLSDEYLHPRIDEPIERALVGFEYDESIPITQHTFNGILGDFVGYIYKQAFSGQRILSVSQSQTEAVEILEKGYQNVHAHGYDAALLDVLNPECDGLKPILSQIAEVIASSQRKKHVMWVYGSRIVMLKWQTKCAIAEILIQRWGGLLPATILNCTPAQLAGHLTELFNLFVVTDKTIDKILMPNTSLNSPLNDSKPHSHNSKSI